MNEHHINQSEKERLEFVSLSKEDYVKKSNYHKRGESEL